MMRSKKIIIGIVVVVVFGLIGLVIYRSHGPAGTGQNQGASQTKTSTLVDKGIQVTSTAIVAADPSSVFRLNLSGKAVPSNESSSSKITVQLASGTVANSVSQAPSLIPAPTASFFTYISSTMLSSMTNLTLLDLSNDNLSSIPPEIGQLKNLQALYLIGNQLTTLPPEIGNLQDLWLLSLFHNDITSLPSSLSQLKKLKVLGLTGNPILQSSTAMDELRKELPGVNIITK